MEHVLFDLIRRRQKLPPEEQYILFLGAGASLSSGGPLFPQLFETVGAKDYDDFSQSVDGLSDSERYALLRPLLEIRSPSTAARGLGCLVRDGFFSTILTTNFDTLVERSLQVAGLGPDDYILLVNDRRHPLTDLDQHLSRSHPRIKVVKLHGDLARRSYALTQQETLAFAGTVQRELERLLSVRDVILIGTRFADLDLLRCTPCQGGSIWYVNPSPPSGYLAAILKQRGCEQNAIVGENARFDSFVTRLCKSVNKFPGQKFRLRWYVLTPFCPGFGVETVPHDIPVKFTQNNRFYYLGTPALSVGEDLRVAWSTLGTAVFVRRLDCEFESICEFAFARSQLYRSLLHGDSPEGSLAAMINSSLSAVHPRSTPSQSGIGYAFSFVVVEEPGWNRDHVHNAMSILCCPSVLRSSFEAEELIDSDYQGSGHSLDIEQRYLEQGFHLDDICRFSVPGIVEGCASWAGVAALIECPDKQKLINAYLDYEVQVQLLWWYLSHNRQRLEDGVKSPLVEDFTLKEARRLMAEITKVGPTENSAMRLYKEAVARTSRLERLWIDFIDAIEEYEE